MPPKTPQELVYTKTRADDDVTYRRIDDDVETCIRQPATPKYYPQIFPNNVTVSNVSITTTTKMESVE